MELCKYLAAKHCKALPSSAEHNSHLETMDAESDALLVHVESNASVDVTFTLSRGNNFSVIGQRLSSCKNDDGNDRAQLEQTATVGVIAEIVCVQLKFMWTNSLCCCRSNMHIYMPGSSEMMVRSLRSSSG